MKKDLRKLLRTIQAQGWTVTKTRGGHFRCASVDGGVVYVASTPSDHRVLRNIRAVLRQHGAAV